MPVVFDEVVAEVEPAPTQAEQGQEGARRRPPAVSAEQIRSELRRLEGRERRRRAD